MAGDAPDGLVHLVREPAGDAEGALILLHGRGVDERDLHPLLDELDPERRLLGITPGAPLTNVAPGGRHWYIVERVGFPHPDTYAVGMDALTAFADALLAERGIGWDRTLLGGFSQGAAMSLGAGFSQGRPEPAGVIAMSGFLPQVEGRPLDLEGRSGIATWISHGTLDPVIGIRFGRSSREQLEAAGVDVTYRESPVGHGIDPGVLPDLRGWIGERFA